MTKPLRQTMPTVTAWIDDLRAAFGADQINASIRSGIDGQGTFHACENGQEVGSRLAFDPANVCPLTECCLEPINPANAEALARANAAAYAKLRRSFL